MSAQWAAGGRPVLGPNDSAGSGNRFDWRADHHSGLPAALAAADHYARNTDVQRRAPANPAAKPAAGAGVASASRSGNGYAHAGNAGARSRWGSLRLWLADRHFSAIGLSHAGPCASLGIFQLRCAALGRFRGAASDNARFATGHDVSLAVGVANDTGWHGSRDRRRSAAGYRAGLALTNEPPVSTGPGRFAACRRVARLLSARWIQL